MAELKLQGWPRELARRGREGKGRGRRGEEGAWGGGAPIFSVTMREGEKKGEEREKKMEKERKRKEK
jgi:hypothetical protein